MLSKTIIQNSEQFLPREREIINDIFRQLGEYNDMSIRYYWCRGMNTDNGVIGAYIPERSHQDKVFIQKPQIVNYSLDVIRQYIIMYFPTIIHELIHRKQYLFSPLKYRLKCIPYIRQHTIEIEARGEELRIEKLINEKGIT